MNQKVIDKITNVFIADVLNVLSETPKDLVKRWVTKCVRTTDPELVTSLILAEIQRRYITNKLDHNELHFLLNPNHPDNRVN